MKESAKRGAVALTTLFIMICLLTGSGRARADYWPTDGWRSSTPEEQGVESGRLVEMFEYLQDGGYQLDSIMVVRNGHMVVDAYFQPFKKGYVHNLRSCTKSITSILVGIALDKGLIKSVDQKVLDFFPNVQPQNLDERKKALALKHLLTMTTGLDARDSYRYQWVGLNEMIASPDWTRHMLDLPMVAQPGEKFDYSNGASYLLAAIIQKTTGQSPLEFARENLFAPLGISNVMWRKNKAGIERGYGGMYLTPHDMAKIGFLYLNKGQWDGRQIVSAAWVDDSTKAHVKGSLPADYGYQWWIAPHGGYYAAVGYEGQFIFVVPEKNMVVVFTATMPPHDFLIPRDALEKYIIPAAASTEPLPENPKGVADLEALTARLAEESGFVWTSPDEGMAKAGLFSRQAAPAFQFNYPPGSRKKKLDAPRQIMSMKTPDGLVFSAGIAFLPEGVTIEDYGPSVFAPSLLLAGSDVKTISNRPVQLKDGSQAYRTDIEWVFRRMKIHTLLVSALRDDKCVYLVAHPWQEMEEAISIVESLRFEP